MTTIVLPTVAASRGLADKLIDAVVLEPRKPATIDSRDLDLNSGSFVSQLIKRLSSAGFESIKVLGGGPIWFEEIERVAKEKGLTASVVQR